MACGRCDSAETGEVCWFCHADMCSECWEEHGHCGHSEADALDALGRKVRQPEARS